MTLSEKIIALIRNSFDTLLYFAVMAVKEDFRDRVSRSGAGITPRGKVAVLGNGPALNEELPRLLHPLLAAERDFMAVNYFAEDDHFEQLRPSYYVLSDPMFFRQSIYRERVMKLYELLDRKVSWPMTLYVQHYNPEGFDYRAVLPNPRIRIVSFHSQMYRGFRNVEFWLFRHGLGSANFGTVVQNGIYVALLLGYKEVELYGVDHTLLDGLTVDSSNRLCRVVSHYYDDRPAELKPIFRNVPHTPYTMSVYLGELAELFRGHEVLRDYAASVGAQIINRTRHSMIDAYCRRPLE